MGLFKRRPLSEKEKEFGRQFLSNFANPKRLSTFYGLILDPFTVNI